MVVCLLSSKSFRWCEKYFRWQCEWILRLCLCYVWNRMMMYVLRKTWFISFRMRFFYTCHPLIPSFSPLITTYTMSQKTSIIYCIFVISNVMVDHFNHCFPKYFPTSWSLLQIALSWNHLLQNLIDYGEKFWDWVQHKIWFVREEIYLLFCFWLVMKIVKLVILEAIKRITGFYF